LARHKAARQPGVDRNRPAPARLSRFEPVPVAGTSQRERRSFDRRNVRFGFMHYGEQRSMAPDQAKRASFGAIPAARGRGCAPDLIERSSSGGSSGSAFCRRRCAVVAPVTSLDEKP